VGGENRPSQSIAVMGKDNRISQNNNNVKEKISKAIAHKIKGGRRWEISLIQKKSAPSTPKRVKSREPSRRVRKAASKPITTVGRKLRSKNRVAP